MTAIKSSLALGLRPSAHILALKEPRSKWTPNDHNIAEAFQSLQDEICPQCGKPVWICRSRDNSLRFTVQTDVCRVTAATDNPKLKKKLKAGEFLYAIPKMFGGKPLPTRDQYYESLAEERAIHEKANATR